MALIKLNNRSSEDTAIHGRRNLIINGAMQVAQRGTSVTGKTDLAYHTVDRWQGVGSGSTYNQSQQAVTLGDSTVGDFKYFLRHEVTTSNDFAGILHKIEDVQSVPEGIVTMSFYAKGTNPGGGSLQVRGRQNFGSGGSPSSEVIEDAQTLTLTSSWQRFTYQITVPSISGKTLGTTANTSYYRIDIQQPGADDTTDAWTLDITGVQIEVGDIATPFEHRSYGEELALCQRYYQIWGGKGTDKHAIAMWIYGTNYASTSIDLPQDMRVAPSFSVVGTVQNSSGGSVGVSNWSLYYAGGWVGCSDLSANTASTTHFRLDANSFNNMTSGGACGLYNGTDCYITLDSEL